MGDSSNHNSRPLDATPVQPSIFRHAQEARTIAAAPDARMTVRTDRTANGLVVHLGEDIDLEVRESLRRALVPLISEPTATIDLTNVGYADTTLLNAIVNLVRKRRACGNNLPPRLVGLHPPIQRLFGITNVDRLVSFHTA